MNFKPLNLPEVLLIQPRVHRDDRGFFLETYQKSIFIAEGIEADFVQDNHSRSGRGVLRGLHFQKEPQAQAKLVRVAHGSIFDVAVDLRPGSATFGQWVGAILDDVKHHLLYIPEGFAHGFLSLENDTDVLYKVSKVYSPQHDAGLLWNDPEIGIQWPDLGQPYLVSAKDRQNPKLKDLLIAG